MLARFVAAFILASLIANRAAAYTFTGSHWTSSNVTVQLQLGASSGTLSDGFASWGASAEDAFATWNSNIAATHVSVVRDSTAARAGGNRINNIFFSADVYGSAWGTGVLAVTLTYTSGASTTETDVLFNNHLNWDSYRGALRFASGGASLFDFHRVALHEFGHVLGLDHPDQAGQTVSALMNSHISSLDALTSDDIAGVRSIYGAPVAAVAPPVITTQPASQIVTVGGSTSFTVSATSSAAVTYQWFKNGGSIAGATAATYSLASVASTDAGSYLVVITNSGGSVTSTAATLTVNPAATIPVVPVTTTTTPTVSTTPAPTTPAPAPTPIPIPAPAPAAPTAVAPFISSQPASQTVNAGASVIFSVSASGTAPLSYQWRKNGAALNGATVSALSLSNIQPGDAGSYSVTVSNLASSTTSLSATLTVNVPPTITSPLNDQLVVLGSRVTFTTAATGTGPLTYQWRKDGRDLPDANLDTLTFNAVAATDAGTYAVVVTNPAGSVTSSTGRLTVAGPPTIATAPSSQTVAAGERVTLSIASSSLVPQTYQWLKDGIEIAGATNPTLVVDAARPGDAGGYSVRVTNAAGTIISPAATLAVKYSRLVNLSTRGYVPPGGALTPGFYVRGAAAKPLLIRAVGPTLSLFGVGTALSEAKLDVIAQDSATIVASSNDWGGSTALRNVFASVGAFPLAADSKDAAVEASLAPRGYSVRVTPGVATMSGVTLAEIYDTESATAASQLVNVSTLGFVGTGDNVLTAGFAISGNAPKHLLIRAVGPGLAPFGVGDRLIDPQFTLVPLGAAQPIAANDDWPDLVNVHAAFTAAGAFALPLGSKDSALVITLDPGAYTVIVTGVGSSTGNALVEIYDLDP